MSKVSRITNPILTKGKQISLPPEVDVLSLVKYDELTPAFSFEYVQGNYCLSKWDAPHIKRLIEELGKLEKHKWKDIWAQHLFQINKVDPKGLRKVSIPTFITPDVTIFYFKPFGSGNKYRVFGVRTGHNFKFLWFDNKHEIYPGGY